MEKIKEIARTVCSRMNIDKKLLIFIVLGFLGIFLLFLSEFIPNEKDNLKNDQTKPLTEYTYAEDVEKKLTDIVSSISGAGKAKVMVTLENGVESVYAKDEKYENEKKSSGENTGSNEKTLDEQEYILLDDDSGGLIIKVIQPKIRGVAVVCEGGDSVYVQQRIKETVSAVLNINSSHISITKMAEQAD